eukprot:1175372-Prorocentrum_minimum.AAC.4
MSIIRLISREGLLTSTTSPSTLGVVIMAVRISGVDTGFSNMVTCAKAAQGVDVICVRLDGIGIGVDVIGIWVYGIGVRVDGIGIEGDGIGSHRVLEHGHLRESSPREWMQSPGARTWSPARKQPKGVDVIGIGMDVIGVRVDGIGIEGDGIGSHRVLEALLQVQRLGGPVPLLLRRLLLVTSVPPLGQAHVHRQHHQQRAPWEQTKTNRTRDAWVYSHGGPIERRTRGYILKQYANE